MSSEMKKYQKRYENSGDIKIFDIDSDNGEFKKKVDDAIIEYTERCYLKPPKFLVMNGSGYSSLCTQYSRERDLKEIKELTEYKGIDIVVINTPGHENNKYHSYFFGIVHEADATYFFRRLNQEQFYD